MLLKLFFMSVVLVLGSSEKVRYDNYALYKVHPQSPEDLKFLKNLEKENGKLDFWKQAGNEGDYASIVAPPEERRGFEHKLAKRSIRSDLMLDNIQEAFEAQIYTRRKRGASNGLFWSNYQTIDEIYEWFEHLATTHSDIVTLVTVGQSFEGRNITGIKISRGNSRRNFILEGGQIGADWLSPTVLTYIVDQLVKGDDPYAKAATQDFAWHIFPIINPDGHQFSQDSVRLWIKNRSRNTSPTAVGVDLSKNWNSQWGIIGGSFTPSADNYIGLGPFSEVETRSLSRYIESIGQATTGFLSFRSFGQRLLIPFAHTTSPMYNYNDMLTIGRRAMGSLAVKYGTQYLVGTSTQVSDGSTGGVADWVKHRFNPPIVATYLLRDNGNWGYTLPITQIQPSCEETYDSLMAILREAKYINVI